jgi:succinylglutamic semialdehyde dehydrogenase
MSRTLTSFQVYGDFIGGKFKNFPVPSGEWVSRSPADFSDEIGRFQCSYSAIDEGVQAAREGFTKWKSRSVVERADYLRKYQNQLKKRVDLLAEAIAREVGKPLWEAKSEVASMMNKVEITISESMKFVSDFEIPHIMENTLGVCRFRPLGVLAVIGPFNFPGHLPNGHIVPALMTGNTVVFKPSEKTPMVGQLMAESFLEAGLPPGVFNLLQGEKEVGRRLCVHEGVDGVLFTGSYEVGTRIKQDTLQQHWKILVLEMGGKNSAIVWEDADLHTAIYETLTGAFLTAGQRCSATSRIIVQKKILQEFLDGFHQKAKAFAIGHPMDNPFMGPLIDQGSVDRYMKFLGIASREGCEVLMRGKVLDLPTRGNYVTPSICLSKSQSVEFTKKSVYEQTELFAPNVAVLGVDTLADAIEQANSTQYGLVASVFTRDRAIYTQCLDQLQFGLVNWNRSTVGASSRLPFGGLKKSGNHFPTALTATQYCTAAIASLETETPHSIEMIAAKTPGLNWA